MAQVHEQSVFNNAVLTAEVWPQSEAEGWQEGAIDPGVQSEQALQHLCTSILGSLTTVAPEQLAFSDCTDGRFRLKLDSGIFVPVREKLVGADTMIAFVMADALGTRFYGNDKASPAERLDEVCAFLFDNKIMPSTHGSCGAAGGFIAVSENTVRFALAGHDSNFISRQKKFVPAYNDVLFGKYIQGLSERLADGSYEKYSDALVTAAVKKYAGDDAVANYQDDGRGVHGHRERAIVRIAEAGITIDTNKLAAMDAKNPQVFVNNDARLERLASLFGRGRDEDYATVYMAGEAFSDAGWGTLGIHLPTIRVRRTS